MAQRTKKTSKKAKPSSEKKASQKEELNWDAPSETLEDSEDRGEKRGLSDLLKNLIASGLSSSFMSEEGLMQYLGEVKLPKDVVHQVLKGAKKSRDELIGRVGGEMSKLIRKIDLVAEARKILADHKITINAEIQFVPKGGGSPEIASEPDKN